MIIKFVLEAIYFYFIYLTVVLWDFHEIRCRGSRHKASLSSHECHKNWITGCYT